MKKEKKLIDGITLIALVITIIILIILVGVTVNILIRDNGIIARALEQKEQQKVNELTDDLIMEKGSVFVDKKGTITAKEYLDYLVKINKLTSTDIEEIEKGSYNITVEKEYVFLVEETDNNDLKIEYQGKAGKLLPRIISMNFSTTTNSIRIVVIGKRVDEYEYYIKKETENESKYVKKGNETTGNYEITGLQQNVSYTVKVVAKNKNGEIYKEKIQITKAMPELVQADIEFIYTPNNWTNSDVKVEVKVIESSKDKFKEYILQTSKNGTDWTTGNSEIFTENGTIYARIVDSINQATDYVSGNVDKIDKVVPNDAVVTFASLAGDSAIVIGTVNHSDSLSGVKIENSKYVYNTISTQIGTQESSYTGGTFISNSQPVTLTTTETGIYYLHILTTDNAGNVKETISSAINITAIKHQHISECKTTATCKITGGGIGEHVGNIAYAHSGCDSTGCARRVSTATHSACGIGKVYAEWYICPVCGNRFLSTGSSHKYTAYICGKTTNTIDSYEISW